MPHVTFFLIFTARSSSFGKPPEWSTKERHGHEEAAEVLKKLINFSQITDMNKSVDNIPTKWSVNRPSQNISPDMLIHYMLIPAHK